MERQKVVLLKAARKRGLGPYLSQLAMSLRDSLWSKRILIFRAGPGDVPAEPPAGSPDLEYEMIERFEDWPEALQERLLTDPAVASWGQKAWFDNGWKVWSCSLDGEVATFCWLYPAGANDTFFDAMEPGSEFIWEVTTLPEFRGRGLYAKMMIDLMNARLEAGVPAIYGCCRDYNATSRRVLPKVGYREVGYIHEPLRFGARVWRPYARA